MVTLKQDPQTEKHLLKDDGIFPNNPKLPLIIYRAVLHLPETHAPAMIEQLFQENGWRNSWRNGIYPYHHYHSITHEVLGIYRGEAEVQLGGPHGIITQVKQGDVILIPAGVAHKNIKSDESFACVGAYPKGKNFDMNYGKKEERPQADRNIEQVPLPDTDPVFGKEGVLLQLWRE